MKKVLLIFSFVINIITVNAQIALEHTFSNESSAVMVFSTNSATYFYVLNSTNNQLKIFNSDYSVYKTLTLTPQTGYKLSNVYQFSTKLFNTDDKIEFIVSSYQISNSSVSSLKLYNENGETLKDFGNRASAMAFTTTSNQTKLVVWGYTIDNTTNPATINYVTDIYTLPGSLSNGLKSFNAETLEPPYPNPTNTIINLPYKLDYGKTSVISIFNTNGQLIEQKQIDATFDKIMLDVSSYKSGVYIYEYNGHSSRFIVN